MRAVRGARNDVLDMMLIIPIVAREQIGLWILEKTVVERDISLNLEQGILTLLSELVSKRAFSFPRPSPRT